MRQFFKGKRSERVGLPISAKRAARAGTIRPKKDPVPTPAPKPGEQRYTRTLTDDELSTIPLLEPTTLEISDKETAKLRRRLYAINRDSISYRYRTMRENNLTLLWRLVRY